MKSSNTSTNCNNICVFAGSGRVGSNYILSSVRSDKSYYCLGEFFNNIPWNVVVYMEIIKCMLKEEDPEVFKFKDWMVESMLFLRRNIKYMFSQNGVLDKDGEEMDRFLKIDVMDLYITATKFFNDINKNTVHKLFPTNTTFAPSTPHPRQIHPTSRPSKKQHRINIENILNMCDTIIIPYRKNALSIYISDKKAWINNIYYIDSKGVNQHRLKESQDYKVLWDKEEYISTFNHLDNNHQYMFNEIYNKFNGAKCVVNFEDLHSKNDKVSYLQYIYDKDNINVKINRDEFNPTVKQSKDQPLEDNFTNPEEFLKDLPDIPIFLNYE